MTLFEELKARGLIAQMTNEEKIRELLDDHKITFYVGFDPTADSLHIGHFLQLVVMSRLQKKGHRPIALLGGGTTMVGDPTGKTDMRKMLTQEDIAHNAECFKVQMRGLVDFDAALMVNNADWLLDLKYIEFLREIGVHFSVNRMLTAECFKSRLERGLSFIEFNYMLMQSYDYLLLHRNYDCVLQLGGDDQWSNILNGADLIRRKDGKEVYGMTFTLLTTSDGKKMGKTEKGAVWLDPEKTTPYDFFQYWRNVADGDVIRCLKLLTFIPLDEIEPWAALEGSALNAVKERLAYEVTAMVHGKDEAEKAASASRALFSAGADHGDMPGFALDVSHFTEGRIGVLDLLAATKLAASKGEARRLIDQNGLEIAGERVKDIFAEYAIQDFAGGLVLKKGKKTYLKVTV